MTHKKLVEARQTTALLRKEIKLLTIENNKLLHLNGLYETSGEGPQVKTIKNYKSKNLKSENGAVIALLSDIHAEEKITLAQTNGANRYNPTICDQRLKCWATNLIKLVDLTREGITLNHLIIGLLGDLIHGFIHEEYLRTNHLTPIQASLFIEEVLGKCFKYIEKYGKFKDITVICKVGNHSRTTTKIYSDEEALHSYEWGVYHVLKQMFPKFNWIIDPSYFTYFKVFNRILRFHHGHKFAYRGGIGGLYVPLMVYLHKINRARRADLDFIGHWHTREFLAGGRVIINGCVCGANSYSITKGFPIESPTQQFLILDQKRGFTINAPIVLS